MSGKWKWCGEPSTRELFMSSYSYVAVDPQGVESRGTLDVSDQSEALRRIKEMGLFPTKVLAAAKPRHRAAATQSRPRAAARAPASLDPGVGWRHQSGDAHGLYPPTGDPGRGRHAVAPRVEDLEEQAENRPLRRIIGELSLVIEGGQFICRSPGSASQGLQPPLHQHGQGRRNRRRAGCDPPAAGRLHGEGAEDQRQSQSGHVLPVRRFMRRRGHSHPPHDLCGAAIQRSVRGVARWRANAALHPVCPAPQRGDAGATSSWASWLPPRWAWLSCAPCGPVGAVGPSISSSWSCRYWGRSSGKSPSPASAAPWGRCSAAACRSSRP